MDELDAYGVNGSNGLGYSSALGALTFGYDQRLNESTFTGIYGGYATGQLESEKAGWDNDMQSAYAGAYVHHSFDRVSTALNLMGGFSWTENEREFTDNTVEGGLVKTEKDANSFFFAPEVTLGYDFNLGNSVVTPSIAGRYVYLRQNGYNEGVENGLKVLGHDAQQFNLRTQVTYAFGNNTADSVGQWGASLRAGLDSTAIGVMT